MPNVEEISQSIPVPSDKVGWVIGKEGSYIKQLSEKSKATIRVSDSTSKEFGREWKYVQISGLPRSVDRAKKLLHIRLERLIQHLSGKKSDPQDDEEDEEIENHVNDENEENVENSHQDE